MMKRYKILVALMIVTGVLFANSTPAGAVPPLPSSFWGMVKVNGVNVPAGTPVSASINGVQYALAFTQVYQDDVYYSLDVPGDDPATSGVIEGGVPGNVIVFKVNGITATETGIWQSGTNVEVNLSLTSLPLIYLPLVAKGNP